MMYEEFRIVRQEDLPKSKLLKKFDNKPMITFLVPFVIGFLMLLGPWVLKGFGIIFILFTLYVYKNYKKEPVVDIYEDYFIIYHGDLDIVTIIKWSEIKSWNLELGKSAEDRILVETDDDQVYYIYMFGIAKVAVYFRKFVFEKNKHEQYKEEENAKGSSFIIGRKRKK